MDLVVATWSECFSSKLMHKQNKETQEGQSNIHPFGAYISTGAAGGPSLFLLPAINVCLPLEIGMYEPWLLVSRLVDSLLCRNGCLGLCIVSLPRDLPKILCSIRRKTHSLEIGGFDRNVHCAAGTIDSLCYRWITGAHVSWSA